MSDYMAELGENPTRGTAFRSIYQRVNSIINEVAGNPDGPLKLEWTHHERGNRKDRNTAQVFAPFQGIWLPLVSRHQLNYHGEIKPVWVAGGQIREDLGAKDKSRMRVTGEYILLVSKEDVIWDLGNPDDLRKGKQRDSRNAGNSAPAEGWVQKLSPSQMVGFSGVVEGLLARCYAADIINAGEEPATTLEQLGIVPVETSSVA